jgi:hypothetical protein
MGPEKDSDLIVKHISLTLPATAQQCRTRSKLPAPEIEIRLTKHACAIYLRLPQAFDPAAEMYCRSSTCCLMIGSPILSLLDFGH